MINVSSASNIDLKQWEQLVKSSPVASYFQTKECYDFYSSLSFLEPFLFGVSDNDELAGVMCGYTISDGGMLKQFFSKRAIVPGGMLLAKNISEEALQTLLTCSLKEIKKKRAIYIEIRNYNDYACFQTIFEASGFKYNAHLNFHIPTLDDESAFKQLNNTKRRHVRVSQKEGAAMMEINEQTDLKKFYTLLSDLYATKIKTTLFPYEFFEKIIKQPNAKIFGIKYQGEIIGGNVCVFLQEKAVYEWFVCGLDGKYKNIYTSTLATWAAIKYAAGHNFTYFDMMGAGKPDESYGVREFKAKFGGELVEYGRFLYVVRPMFFVLGKKIIQIIKKNSY